MSKRNSPGDSVVARLANRSQGGLYRKQLADGGEVYTGPTATRALRSLGARAFTMDRSIFVSEDFDENDPVDQALYAHERHHQLNSGGTGAAESYYDAEELAARAIERMVLHRRETGEDFGSILRDVNANIFRKESDVAAQDTVEAPTSDDAKGKEDSAADALQALLGAGKSQEQIVQALAKEIVEMIQEQESHAKMEGGSVGFL